MWERVVGHAVVVEEIAFEGTDEIFRVAVLEADFVVDAGVVD